jgi:hypothetical protein
MVNIFLIIILTDCLCQSRWLCIFIGNMWGLSLHDSLFFAHVYRKDGQQTQEELQKRNLREEIEEHERKHYSSKDKSYSGIPTFPVSSFCFSVQDSPRISL